MSLNNEQITENILESITTLVQAEVKKISYDRTLIFTITDDSHKTDGYYTVSDDEKTFDAFSSEEYKIGDKVYVTIPEGDYENNKIIVSKYTSEEDIANHLVSYIPPEREVIEVEKYEFNSTCSITCTGDQQRSENKVYWLDWGYRQIDNNFTSLLIRCKFKTLFPYEVVSGNYGVKLAFITAPGTLLKSQGDNFIDFGNIANLSTMEQIENFIAEYNEALEEDEEEYKLLFNTSTLKLDTSSMIGNIYNSSLLMDQSISYDISNYNNIVGCYICLYQDGDFKYQSLSGVQALPESDSANLQLISASISFGYMEKDYQKGKDELVISTTDTYTFLPSTAPEEINAKDIAIRWLYWDEEANKHVYIRENTGFASEEVKVGANLNHTLVKGPNTIYHGIGGYTEQEEILEIPEDVKYEVYWYEEKTGAIGDKFSGFYWNKIKTTPYWDYDQCRTHYNETFLNSKEQQEAAYNGFVLSWLQRQRGERTTSSSSSSSSSTSSPTSQEQIRARIEEIEDQLSTYTDMDWEDYEYAIITYGLTTIEEFEMYGENGEGLISQAAEEIGKLTIEKEELEGKLNNFSFIFTPIVNLLNTVIKKFKTLNRFSQLFNYVYTPNTQNSSIELKAILVRRVLLEGENSAQFSNEEPVAESNSLKFYNEQEIEMVEPGQIILTVEDAVKEFYIYGENGQLENSNYDNQVFTIKANLPSFDETEAFDDFTITWNLPLVNSMLDNIFPTNTLGRKGDGTISSQNKGITVQQVQAGYNFFKYYPNSEAWLEKTNPDEIVETYIDSQEKLQASIDYYGDTLSITYILQRKNNEEFKDYLNRCQSFCYQSFSIKNYFNASSSNNSISCTILIGINSKKLWGEKTLVFGQNFSSGTQYNFSIFYKNETDQGFYNHPNGGFNNIKIVPQLHGKGINLSEDDKREWLSTVQIAGTNGADSTFFSLINTAWEDNDYVWTFGLKLDNSSSIDLFNEILKATITINGTTLSAYLAVPINNFPQQYQGISAPTIINYSGQGSRLNYNKDGLKLFKVPATSGEENGVVRSFNIVEKPYSQAPWNYFPSVYNNGIEASRITIKKDNSKQYMYIRFVPNTTLENGGIAYGNLSSGTTYYLGVRSKNVDYSFKYISYDSTKKEVTAQGLSQTISFDGNYASGYDYLIRNKPYGSITTKITLEKDTKKACIDSRQNSGALIANKHNIIRRETHENWYTLSREYNVGDQFCYSSSSGISVSGGTIVTINKKIYRDGTYYYELDTSITDGNYYLRSVCSIPNKLRSNQRVIVENTDFNTCPLINAENTVGLRWITENKYEIEIFNDTNKNRIRSLIEQLQTWKDSNPLTTSYSDEILEYENYCYLTLTNITKEWKYYYFNYSINDENNRIQLTFIGQNGATLDDVLDFRDFASGAKEAYLYYLYFPEYEVKEYITEIGALEEKNAFWALNSTEITNDNGVQYNFKIFDIVGKHEKLVERENGNKLKLNRTKLNQFKFATLPESREYISMQGQPYFSGEIIDGDTDDWWCQWYLNPYHVYTSGQEQISLICYTLQETPNGAVLTPVWIQPLIIKQNLYELELVNGWDGQTTIGESYILSEAIGAGSKNSDNQFSGVLMGKVESSIDDYGAQHGLYGFSNGAQAFGFRENGTAFIGKSNSGRIEFDGEKGVITSSGMGKNGPGTDGIYIDLDTPQFLIKSGGTSLMNFSRNNQTIKSSNNGLVIDLNKGIIETTQDFTLQREDDLFQYGITTDNDTLDKEDYEFVYGITKKDAGVGVVSPRLLINRKGGIEGTNLSISNFNIKNNSFSTSSSWTNIINDGKSYNDSTGWFASHLAKNGDTSKYFPGVVIQIWMANIAISSTENLSNNEYYHLYLNIFIPITDSAAVLENRGRAWFDIRPNFSIGSRAEHFAYYYNNIEDCGVDTIKYDKSNVKQVILPVSDSSNGTHYSFQIYTNQKNKLNNNNKVISLPSNFPGTTNSVVKKGCGDDSLTFSKNSSGEIIGDTITFNSSSIGTDWLEGISNKYSDYESIISSGILSIFVKKWDGSLKINNANFGVADNLLDCRVKYTTTKIGDEGGKTYKNYFYIDALGETHISKLYVDEIIYT